MQSIGDRFGSLTVVAEHAKVNNRAAYLCLCDCGNERVVRQKSLRSGEVSSCGCRPHALKRGYEKNKPYSTWIGMIQRTTNPNSKSYPRYGGRGIKVCDEWRSFRAFHRDMGDPPDGMELDRIDNNTGYSKENCRWVPRKDNARNKSNNRLITYNGESRCLAEWEEIVGIKAETIYTRIYYRGWSVEEALTIKASVGSNQRLRGHLSGSSITPRS